MSEEEAIDDENLAQDAPSIEDIARAAGWDPEKGDKTAAEYVSSGLDYRRNLKNELDDLKAGYKRIDDWRERAEKAGYERAMAEIEARKNAAREEGDVEAYEKAVKAEADLPKPAETDDVTEAWIEQNQWFKTDRVLHFHALGIDQELRQKHPGMGQAELLEKVTETMKARYPESFGITPKKDAKPPAAEGRARRGASNGRTWNDLPPEVQREADAMIRNKWVKDRDEYLKNYNGWT